jgi:hypothetical protein
MYPAVPFLLLLLLLLRSYFVMSNSYFKPKDIRLHLRKWTERERALLIAVRFHSIPAHTLSYICDRELKNTVLVSGQQYDKNCYLNGYYCFVLVSGY